MTATNHDSHRLWPWRPQQWQEIQHSWQTSALAMHSPRARLVSIFVIFCLLLSSRIVMLVFYLFSTGISEQHVWELWVWIQFTGLTLPLRGTPVNNPQQLYHQYSPWATFCRWQTNFRTVFSESHNGNPLDAEPKTDFNANNHSRSFKVIYY